MSTKSVITTVDQEVAVFYINDTKVTIILTTKCDPITKYISYFYVINIDGMDDKDNKYTVRIDIEGFFCIHDKILNKTHKFGDSNLNKQLINNQLFTPSYNKFTIIQSTEENFNDDKSIDEQSTDDHLYNNSISGTSIESSDKTVVTVPEPYSKVASKNVSQKENPKKFTQIKNPKKSIKKEDLKISTEKINVLVKLVTEFVTSQHKDSIFSDIENQICITVDRNIRYLLLKLTDSEVKLFESEINKICDKDLKYSIGPSTINMKFTRVLKLHHDLVKASL